MRGRARVVIVLGLLTCGCAKEKSTDELIADLKSPQEKDRITAVRLLPHRKRDAAQVIPALIESLNSKDREVQTSAALGLGSFGAQAKDAIPALKALLQDRDIRVREAAGKALSRIDPSLTPGSAAKP